jgi:hypothetical protein
MGTVADLAAIHANSRMFEHEWSALVGMTLEARLLVGKGLLHHARAVRHPPGWRGRSVGIMAIRTVHETFVNPVLKRHGELGSNGKMTAVAKLSLLLGEQKLRHRRFVDGVAT